ncbi:MAG: hypothetical protein PHN72_02180 [Bacilli bacterium]|nr:hypothetical protein [Bacilli bacterium]
MSKQNINYSRQKNQNNILDLEEKYMHIIENIVTSRTFLEDLKNIESETQEYYEILQEVWGKKNKIKDASERLLRHHMYTNFNGVENFYPSPISCDIALELKDIILNLDVKTIDKVGNKGELDSTQFEHNQTSFLNDPVDGSGSFPGFKVKSNLQAIDSRTGKPLLTYLVKIGYSDDGHGNFKLINDSKYPSIVVTCLPNGILSNLFDNNLFLNFKDYIYYAAHDGPYYKPKYITSNDEFSNLNQNNKFSRIEQNTDIPDHWERIIGKNKIGYYDNEKKQLWYTVQRKKDNHKDIFLEAVKYGNTARFNDVWLEERYNSKNKYWCGERKYYRIYDKLNEEFN